jgi:ubiquinone/menaquinone biosynthesis C-methylase UbiE
MKMENEAVKYHARSSYKDEVAGAYDRKRSKRRKWKKEMAAIRTLVSEFHPDDSVLDIPVGTGRFLPIYFAAECKVYGFDISEDMLSLAQEKNVRNAGMALADAEHIPLPDKSIDYVVCIRLLNWVTRPVFKVVIKELQRVARKGIVLGFRSEVPMTIVDFLKLGAISIIPTPRHIVRWAKGWPRFYGRVKGKLNSLLNKNGRNRDRGTIKLHSNDKQKVFKGSTYYDPEKTAVFFDDLGLIIDRSFPIDTRPAFLKWKTRPYSIYSVKFQ